MATSGYSDWEWVGSPQLKDTTYQRNGIVYTDRSIVVTRRRAVFGNAMDSNSQLGDTALSVSAYVGSIQTTYSPADANISYPNPTIDCIAETPEPIAGTDQFYQVQTWESYENFEGS